MKVSGLLLFALVASFAAQLPVAAPFPQQPPLLNAGLLTNNALRSVLAEADSDLDRLCDASLRLSYDIFRGRSALRDLSPSDALPLDPAELGVVLPPKIAALHRASAVLLLLRGLGDAAHDVLLGVTRADLDEAEYAATHPGETSWAADHPLTSSADLIHAAIHRLEGSEPGEGGHEGYENAKFWLAGGPKRLDRPAPHSVRTALADRARRFAPRCVQRGVIALSGGAEHTIIAGGGRTRTVLVPEGEWDGFAFVDLCRLREDGGGDGGERLTEVEEEEVIDLQRFEMVELLRAQLAEAGVLGTKDSSK